MITFTDSIIVLAVFSIIGLVGWAIMYPRTLTGYSDLDDEQEARLNQNSIENSFEIKRQHNLWNDRYPGTRVDSGIRVDPLYQHSDVERNFF